MTAIFDFHDPLNVTLFSITLNDTRPLKIMPGHLNVTAHLKKPLNVSS